MSGPLWKDLGALGQARKAGAAPTYQQKILANVAGIMGYWPLTPANFTNGAGGVLDVSGNARHGTNTNAIADQLDGPSAAMGRAPSFGGNSVIVLPSMPRNTSGTVAVWAKQSPLSGSYRTIFFTNRAYVQRRSSGTTVYNQIYGPNVNSGDVSNASAGNWCCYTLYWETNNIRGFVDSTQIWSLASWTPSALGSIAAYIGDESATPSVASFAGYIMHVLLLDHVATAGELTAIRSSAGS